MVNMHFCFIQATNREPQQERRANKHASKMKEYSGLLVYTASLLSEASMRLIETASRMPAKLSLLKPFQKLAALKATARRLPRT